MCMCVCVCWGGLIKNPQETKCVDLCIGYVYTDFIQDYPHAVLFANAVPAVLYMTYSTYMYTYMHRRYSDPSLSESTNATL